jgi:hypothetical protein
MQYLKTLESFLALYDSDKGVPKRTWRKLGTRPSGFLDMVVEAAWALHIVKRPFSLRLEVPFDPSKPRGKDADLVLKTDQASVWMDVTSVDFNENKSFVAQSQQGGVPRPRPEVIRNALVDRACNKYSDKFSQAIRNGHLTVATVGILLCVLKSEAIVLHSLMNTISNTFESLPSDLKQRAPGLSFVVIHRLAAPSGCDLLEPYPFLVWSEPKAETLIRAFAFGDAT